MGKRVLRVESVIFIMVLSVHRDIAHVLFNKYGALTMAIMLAVVLDKWGKRVPSPQIVMAIRTAD